MNIILFGPPGAGKGTQADNLVKNYKLYKVSTGDLLREEINKQTNIGNEIKKKIDQGYFVSDQIINNLITKIVANKSHHNSIIFDGYPRNVNQAKSLDVLIEKYKQKISIVLSLEVSKDIIAKRILGRVICTKCDLIFNKYFNPPDANKHTCDSNFLKRRSDDNEETIMNRIKTYEKETLPLFNYYDEQKILHKVDGMGKIDQIYEEIRSIIASLET